MTEPGSSHEVLTKYQQSSGYSGGWNTGGNWGGGWWGKKPKWATNIMNLLIDNQGDLLQPDSETLQLVSAFSTSSSKYWIMNGLRQIVDDVHDITDSFEWFRLIPFCAKVSKLNKTSLLTIEPGRMRHHDAEGKYNRELKLLAKEGWILREPELRLPVLASMIRNAPTLDNVTQLLKAVKGIKEEKLSWNVFIDEMEYKMNRYKWPTGAKAITSEMNNLLK